jgi:hypothetical protein
MDTPRQLFDDRAGRCQDDRANSPRVPCPHSNQGAQKMLRRANILKVCVSTAIALVCLTAQSQAASNPDGTWKWSFTTQNGQQIDFTLNLKHEGEKLTGSMMTAFGDIEVKDGTYKNDEVNFKTVFERDGNTFTTKYNGKVDGDTIKGQTERERNGQTMKRDWEAKREKKDDSK